MITKFRGENFYLSNFYDIPIEYKGYVFNNVESAYQAAKCANIRDYERFLNLTGAQAKRKGKTVKMREDWEEVKLPIMIELVKKKFEDPELRHKLLSTKDEEIIHLNTWKDTFWGVYKNEGFNHLGLILMDIRNEIKC